MPKLTDKTTGEVVGEYVYNNEGIQAAENAADNNPNLEVEYATTDAANRSEVTYLGGGAVPEYREGGNTAPNYRKFEGRRQRDLSKEELAELNRMRKELKKQVGRVGDKKKEAPVGSQVGTVGDPDDIFADPELIGTYPKKKKKKKKK
mgnify:CR=1 FL=1